MPPTLQEFGFDALSPADRLVLGEVLWNSVLELQAGAPVHPAIQAELERRGALSDGNPTRGALWEDVRKAARVRWVK